MGKDIRYPFVFIKDADLKALVHHAAPFTGLVAFVVPQGTKAVLDIRMSTYNHYIRLQEGSYSRIWLEHVYEKAKKESPIPKRVSGLSFFASVKTLLSEHVVFEPSIRQEVLSMLREEYEQAYQCALREETEEFKKWVKLGATSPQIDEEDRKEILSDKGQ